MFRITGGKGFHIEFPNGYSVSVQFGPGNYCDNRNADFNQQAKCGEKGSKDAEVAVFHKEIRGYWSINDDGAMIKNDDVMGWQTPVEVARIIDIVSKA